MNMKKIAIITGASAGMGKEFALQIAAFNEDDEIWLIARRRELLESLSAEITKNYKPAVKIICLDLAGTKGVNAFDAILKEEISACEKTGKKLVVNKLVNNAGFGTYGPFEKTPLVKELEMTELNCTTLVGLCGLCLPYMQKNSLLINTASLASFWPLGNFAVYGASKAYVLSFTMALAAEVAERGIKVCALCPGPVSTEFANVASNGARKEVRHGLDPAKVVAHCLKRARKGKKTAIMAPKWKFRAFLSRFIGRYFGALATYKWGKRPYNWN